MYCNEVVDQKMYATQNVIANLWHFTVEMCATVVCISVESGFSDEQLIIRVYHFKLFVLIIDDDDDDDKCRPTWPRT